MLGKITDWESLESFQEKFHDEVSFSKFKNLKCSDCNFAIKGTHYRFFLEYVPKTSCLKNRIKSKKVFFLRKKTMMDQRLNKVAFL